jgi:uncharacterized protein (DUF2237 family)
MCDQIFVDGVARGHHAIEQRRPKGGQQCVGVGACTVCNPAGMEEFFRSAGWDLATHQPDNWVVDPAVLRAAATACGQRILDAGMPESLLLSNVA